MISVDAVDTKKNSLKVESHPANATPKNLKESLLENAPAP